MLSRLWRWVTNRRLLDARLGVLGLVLHVRLLALYHYGRDLHYGGKEVLYLAALHLAPLAGVSLQIAGGEVYLWLFLAGQHWFLPRRRAAPPRPRKSIPYSDVPF